MSKYTCPSSPKDITHTRTVDAMAPYRLNFIAKWPQQEKLGESPYKLILPLIYVEETTAEKNFPSL